MTKLYKLHLTDGVHSLTVSPGTDGDLRLLEDGLEGFGTTELLVETEPYADGSGGHPVTRRFGERYLCVTAEMNGDTDALRRRICGMMNPLNTLELTVTLGDVTRRIAVIPSGQPLFRQANFYTPVEAELPFLAPDPFYRAEKEEKVVFWQSVPLLTFPMNFMKGAGLASGYYRTTDTAHIVNPGDADCGFCASLTAVGGTVENPVIVCGDRYIRLQMTLEEGDTAQIDTRPRCKNVYRNGVRCFTFHRNSDFFLLAVGENEIRVTADSGIENLTAGITFTPLYYGI